MRREDLHHVVAAAAQIVGETEFVIVGSQAILGSFPKAPEALLRSQEADIYPRHAPDKAVMIEGALGDGSHFQQTFGYYAHAVGPETAKAPAGWEDRLVVVEVPLALPATCERSRSAWSLTTSFSPSSRPTENATGTSLRRPWPPDWSTPTSFSSESRTSLCLAPFSTWSRVRYGLSSTAYVSPAEGRARSRYIARPPSTARVWPVM